MGPRRTAAAPALLLVASLALAGCGGGTDAAGGGSSTTGGPGALGEVTPAPTTAATKTSLSPSATPSSGNAGLGSASTQAPTVTAWEPPSLKFYDEDYSVWRQDDSVVNQGAVTDKGSSEGYRTYDNACMGYETRDITREIHSSGMSDEAMSQVLIEESSDFSDYEGDDPSTVDLVRDDDGTMEGLSTSYTATYTYADKTTESVEGFRYARAVGDAGLQVTVVVMCKKGEGVSEDQWHTVLSGIRIEGLKAGTFEEDDS